MLSNEIIDRQAAGVAAWSAAKGASGMAAALVSSGDFDGFAEVAVALRLDAAALLATLPEEAPPRAKVAAIVDAIDAFFADEMIGPSIKFFGE